MSVHVNKENDTARITFESAQFEEVYIETEWTILSGGKGDEAARSASLAVQNLNTDAQGSYT